MTIERLVCHTRTRNQARKACKGFALVVAARRSCCRVASPARRCENIGVWPLLSWSGMSQGCTK